MQHQANAKSSHLWFPVHFLVKNLNGDTSGLKQNVDEAGGYINHKKAFKEPLRLYVGLMHLTTWWCFPLLKKNPGVTESDCR